RVDAVMAFVGIGGGLVEREFQAMRLAAMSFRGSGQRGLFGFRQGNELPMEQTRGAFLAQEPRDLLHDAFGGGAGVSLLEFALNRLQAGADFGDVLVAA